MTGETLPPNESTVITSESASDSVSALAEGVTPSTQPDESTPALAEAPRLEENEDLDGQSGGQSSFADALSAFEREHYAPRRTRQLQGTVVSLSADQVVLDIGYKMEGVLPRSAFPDNAEGVKPGDAFPVSITGRNEEGYYELSRFRVAQPRDWSALEARLRRKNRRRRHRHRRHQRRPQRRRRRPRLHARQPQRHARRSRARSSRRPADHLPHHQARRHR